MSGRHERPDGREGRDGRGALPGHRHRPDHVVVAPVPRDPRERRREPSADEVERAAQQQRRRRRRLRLGALAVVVVVALVIGVSMVRGPLTGVLPWSSRAGDDVFAGRTLFRDDSSQAARAADAAASQGRTQDAEVLRRLAQVPTAIWLTPEATGRGAVGTYVRDTAARADGAGQASVFVVYGVTDRDCTGEFSAGGLPPDEYRSWVGEIAAALGATEHTAVVLEPDGLAATFECGNREQRVELIAAALGSLVDAGVPVYVDAGHSDWRDVDEMAQLLRDVGVDRARGFATNVAGYQTDDQERTYAEALSDRLDGAHYVVDTGRNGGSPTQDWCNPDGRILGREPAGIDDGSRQDARLWVKPPGESDGTCNGGPTAGQFWEERALEMAAASGW